jgi:hypothetical protein
LNRYTLKRSKISRNPSISSPSPHSSFSRYVSFYVDIKPLVVADIHRQGSYTTFSGEGSRCYCTPSSGQCA